MVDLNEVRMFVQVVRARSFAEAARRLGVPSNTLSRRIRQLEATVATRLMQRSTRKLTLTTAGHAFFDGCAAAVDAMVEAGRELVDGSQTPSGTVRIAAPADFLDLFTMDWVAEFMDRYPGVRLDFVLSDARADLIGEGIDVAFRGGRSDDSHVPFREILAQYYDLVASPGYLRLRGAPRMLAELADHECLTVSGRSTHTTWTLQGPHGDEQVTVAGRFSANSARILMTGATAGFGVALLPGILTAKDLRAGRLMRVLPQYRRDGANFKVLLPSRRHVPTAVSVFVEFAVDKLQSVVSATEDAAISAPRRGRSKR